jgi:hypothetical protein
VSTPQRSSALPDVPTTLEAGYKNSDYTFWTGLFVPAKTPREITGLPTPVGFGSTSLNPGGSGFETATTRAHEPRDASCRSMIKGMFTAPGRCPNANSSSGRTSRTVTVPARRRSSSLSRETAEVVEAAIQATHPPDANRALAGPLGGG